MRPLMIRDAHLLVTGGAGFIGTALTRRLAPHNRIRVLDNLRRNALAEAGLAFETASASRTSPTTSSTFG